MAAGPVVRGPDQVLDEKQVKLAYFNRNITAELKQHRQETCKYQNNTLIERYVDSFWLSRCPDHYHTRTIEKEVRVLIGQLITKG